MKVIGSKVWAGIPENLKSLPFRKTFSKHLKLSFISDLPSNRRTRIIERSHMNDEQYEIMASLFESSDEEQEDFHGFDLEFESLFNSSREDDASEFLGFDLGFEAQNFWVFRLIYNIMVL